MRGCIAITERLSYSYIKTPDTRHVLKPFERVLYISICLYVYPCHRQGYYPLLYNDMLICRGAGHPFEILRKTGEPNYV